MCSDRKTQQAEDLITTQTLREITFEQMFSQHEEAYDAVIIDVAPSLTLFQTCAMVYTKQVLVPVAMETLSVQGAAASIQAGHSLNSLFKRKPDICVVGILPVMVDRRLNMTDIVMNTLEELSSRDNVAILPAIRTDTSVVKAGRHRKFLVDYDPKSKALEDYTTATEELLRLLQERDNANTRQLQTA
jgi:chromosome partitioning protein